MSVGQKKIKLAFLAPYPAFESPSQRFRFEHYLPYLPKNNITYTYHSFVSKNVWKIIFKDKNVVKKALGILSGFFRRFILLFKLIPYHYVFIHREAAPVGPPIFEFLISKVLRKKIIYDFDDAIWVQAESAANPGVSLVKWYSKINRICKWSWKVSVGNKYLAAYALQFNKNIVIVPTIVDTDTMHNKIKNQADEPLTIGWTGTFTNFPHLAQIIVAIKKLQANFKFRFLIIADRNPNFTEINYEYLPWKKDTEIEDLMGIHIGVMPLNDSTILQLGKCGLKAIQYQALGIPAVVSPIGVNREVVLNHQTGFWAQNDNEWLLHLSQLLADQKERTEMGQKAREHMINNYSVKSSVGTFINLFKG
jgi:glycosyltransferase involved in cell wall biosynthesis